MEGGYLTMVGSTVDYLAESKFGATLHIQVNAEIVSDKVVDFTFAITDANSGKEVARVKTNLLYFDFEAGRPAVIPAAITRKIEALRNNRRSMTLPTATQDDPGGSE